MSREIVEAVRELEREKNLESGVLVSALRDGLLAAYKKTPGAYRHATVDLDDEGEFRVIAIHMPADLEEKLLDEARERALTDLERIEEETGERQHTLLSDDDLQIDWDEVPENLIEREDVTPEGFGRIAAQTAKQVIQQRIREAERQIMYEEYIDRVSEVVTGIVQQAGDRNNVLVDLGKVEALLPRSEQVDGERYEQGSRIKAVITEVRSGTKGPQVILSRRDPELIRTLFELEVPEIADGLVEIRGVAREPGYRSKIAVESHTQGVDPVGACVGPRGSRVRMVVSELRGEKIDIIPWNTEPARFIAKALSPARVREVLVDDDTREATVIVPEDQLALAIGKEGLNARLATRLTGWKIDITSDVEFAQQEAEAAFGGGERGEEEFSGRCAAILANGKRCPNASLPGHPLLRHPRPPGARQQGTGGARRPGRADRRPVGQRRRRGGRGRGACRPRGRAGGRCRRRDRGARRRVMPTRTCAGCGRKAEQAELVRFVAPEGVLTPGRRAARPRRVHVPEASTASSRRAPGTASTAPSAGGAGRSGARSSLHWSPLMANDRPNRPIRPRGPVGGRRKRRVVIDTQASRPRPDSRQARDRPAERPKSTTPAAPPTGPVTVPSGVTVRDFSQALGVPAAQLIKIMMGLGKMIQITQSLTDDDVELIATALEPPREVTIRHAADEEPEPEVSSRTPPRT